VNVVVVHSHPCAGSFVAAMRDTTLEALHRAGADVHLIDLWAEGFDPVAATDDGSVSAKAVDDHVSLLDAAEMLVLVYPTWWSGQPAILTGWLAALPFGAMQHIRRLVCVTSHGSTKRVNMLEGETGKRIVERVLPKRCAPRAVVEWIAMYGLDTASAEKRTSFLEQISLRLAAQR
jgi:NAD(P)H dehydrogenase (quinone)